MTNIHYNFTSTNIECPVTQIMGMWEFKRPAFFKYLCYSLSGHLLHMVTKGSYLVKINGVAYNVKEGDVIYYYESEEVETIGGTEEVIFYSVSYQAPSLFPLPIDKRIISVDSEIRKLFDQLYKGFSFDDKERKSFIIYSNLLAILYKIGHVNFDYNEKEDSNELWWAIERRIRKNKSFRPSLSYLSEIAGYSRATLIRSCKRATGHTPINRIRKIRMEEARSLLTFANINVTQVSEYLGYNRVHEFSREFSKYYGEPPSKLIIR
ncbi:AraC family transcriptional regulator [Arenibacter aquaticus]|uniref:AraC family transcriptional regulator n=1 Tax=Arenibacter aquaticus TaxID=2489054 RepID=A0A430K4T5_9FLAO|nr:AraC family transcriptional regulator [Arenibacter aquaticus]RTE53989.1 AraC family transcriptional regulator [Arenibacter aquaticus]